MKWFCIALCLGAYTTAQAGETDFRCLKSEGPGKPIQLQFDFPADARSNGWVTYRNGSGRIAVRRTGAQETDSPEGRPAEYTTTWKEAGPTGSGGVYTVVSQGARIYGFSFRRAKDGKVFEFGEDLEATDERACSWNRR